MKMNDYERENSLKTVMNDLTKEIIDNLSNIKIDNLIGEITEIKQICST